VDSLGNMLNLGVSEIFNSLTVDSLGNMLNLGVSEIFKVFQTA